MWWTCRVPRYIRIKTSYPSWWAIYHANKNSAQLVSTATQTRADRFTAASSARLLAANVGYPQAWHLSAPLIHNRRLESLLSFSCRRLHHQTCSKLSQQGGSSSPAVTGLSFNPTIITRRGCWARYEALKAARCRGLQFTRRRSRSQIRPTDGSLGTAQLATEMPDVKYQTTKCIGNNTCALMRE